MHNMEKWASVSAHIGLDKKVFLGSCDPNELTHFHFQKMEIQIANYFLDVDRHY